MAQGEGPGLSGPRPAARTWSWTVRVLGWHVTMRHDLSPVAGGTWAGLTVVGPVWLTVAYGMPARLALRSLCRRRL